MPTVQPHIVLNEDFDVANLPVAGGDIFEKNGIKQIFVAHKVFTMYPFLNMDAEDSIEDDIFLIERIRIDLYIDSEMKVYRVENAMRDFLPFHLIKYCCQRCKEQITMIDEVLVCEECNDVITNESY